MTIPRKQQDDTLHHRNTAIARAAGFLVGEQKKGYPEGTHHLKFPVLTPAGVRFETHGTVLFQRLIVLDSLLNVHGAGIQLDPELIQREVEHCIASKHPYVRGGWSYMPHLPPFPPDTDDLAAVLHVAARVRNNALSAICDDALQVVDESSAHADGSIETWIVDRSDASPRIAAVKRYIEVIGGVGVHPEVVANLLSGILEYAPGRFPDLIDKGVKYLLSVQDSEGYWPSKWYWGAVYGTFRSLQVLRAADGHREAVKNAVTWVARTHRPEACEDPDPLSTALAMLCLAPEHKVPGLRDICVKSGDWLVEKQHEDGSWDAGPFIKMETRNGVLTYGSRTVTTAFCLKALLGVHRKIDVQALK